MEKNEYLEIIEKIIKNHPAVRGNEDMTDFMCKETLKKAESFLENASFSNEAEIYLKKIINSVILETVKNVEKLRKEQTEDTTEVRELSFFDISKDLKTDRSGKIVFQSEIPLFEEEIVSSLSENTITKIKEQIITCDKENAGLFYKKIFELRYIKGFSVEEISKSLEISEPEVLRTLFIIYSQINALIYCS